MFSHFVGLALKGLRFEGYIVRLVIAAKSKVSSANSFALQRNPSGKSLM